MFDAPENDQFGGNPAAVNRRAWKREYGRPILPRFRDEREERRRTGRFISSVTCIAFLSLFLVFIWLVQDGADRWVGKRMCAARSFSLIIYILNVVFIYLFIHIFIYDLAYILYQSLWCMHVYDENVVVALFSLTLFPEYNVYVFKCINVS